MWTAPENQEMTNEDGLSIDSISLEKELRYFRSTQLSGPIQKFTESSSFLYLNSLFSDVQILVGGHKLPAHRFVLSSRCEHLKILLAGIRNYLSV